MSIVEKALSKLQSSGKAPGLSHQAPRVIPAAAPATQSEPATIPARSEKVELLTHHRLEVDAEALRTAGLLPPQQDSLALRNHFRRLKWPILDGVAAQRREGHALGGVLMVASAVAGEGKSFISCNLALSIAREEGSRVVLIDADIARAHLSESLALRDKPGLTDYLSNSSTEIADVLYSTSIERLYILPSGRFVPHASELLSGARMHQLLKSLVSGGPGNVVVLDTSPVLATNEAQVLSRIAPQILLVVRADSTPQPSVQEACNLLGREKVCAVLNQVNTTFATEPYNTQYGTYGNESRQ